MAVRRRLHAKKGGEFSPPSRRLQTSASKRKFILKGEIAEVRAGITKKYAPGVIRTGSDKRLDYGRLSSGILSLDLALAGGLKLSRGSMFYGEKSAGKSTLAAIMIGRAQKAYPDGVPIWLDIEGTFDKGWARKLGVDLDRLEIVEPESGEAAVDIADGLLRAYEVPIIVTDSIAFLTPMKEIKASAEDSLPGIHARLVGNYIRRLNNALLQERHRKHTPIVLHLNQFRMRIGVMFGDPRVLPGGKALEFSTSQQLQIYNKEVKGKDDEGNDVVLFNDHHFIITKDKTGGRIKEGKFKLIRDKSTGLPEGTIDQSKTVIAHCKRLGMYSGAGQNQRIEGCCTFRSAEALGEFFVEHPKKLEDINRIIIQYYMKKWGVDE